jgi:hypothetical protein
LQCNSGKNRADRFSDVGASQHVRRGFIQLIAAADFFKTRQIIHAQT